MPVEFDIAYALDGRDGAATGRANDLSVGGLRLLCEEELPVETLLQLQFRLPDAFLEGMTVEKELYEQSPFGLRPETVKTKPQGFAPLDLRGRIMTAAFDERRRCFTHGVSFVNLQSKIEDELQRFMHLWQINFLRSRNQG